MTKKKSHCLEDEELRNLVKAKKLFQLGCSEKNCDHCQRAWKYIDLAILAKYTDLAKKEREKTDGV